MGCIVLNVILSALNCKITFDSFSGHLRIRNPLQKWLPMHGRWRWGTIAEQFERTFWGDGMSYILIGVAVMWVNMIITLIQ